MNKISSYVHSLFSTSKQYDDSNIQSLREVRSLYLGLMKECLTYLIYADARNKDTLRYDPVNPMRRPAGLKWPSHAHTMIGMKRLDNIQFCVEDVLARNIEGDLIEAGVWRGGGYHIYASYFEELSDT